MPVNEEADYQRSMSRITRLIVVFGAAGTVYLAIAKGLRFGGGFLLGSAISWFSFWRWRRIVEAFGSETSRPRTIRWIVRLLLIAGAAYVILKYLEVNIVAALSGLLVAAAAVVFEIVYQLFTART